VDRPGFERTAAPVQMTIAGQCALALDARQESPEVTGGELGRRRTVAICPPRNPCSAIRRSWIVGGARPRTWRSVRDSAANARQKDTLGGAVRDAVSFLRLGRHNRLLPIGFICPGGAERGNAVRGAILSSRAEVALL
jgi:hypothetical protein